MDQTIRIAVASPGDVGAERNAVVEVCTSWNVRNTGTVLVPILWEQASVPGLGDHPQHILNKQIIEQSDLLIAILWSRIGTPTPTARSGTLEEIREFISAKGPGRVMLYFCKRAVPYETDPEQWNMVKEFKKEMGTFGLFHEYESVEAFKGSLYKDLDGKIEELYRGDLPLPQPKRTDPPPNRAANTNYEFFREPDSFGNTFAEVAQRFSERMAEFNAIDGVHGERKFYRLAEHTYSSVAISIETLLAQRRLELTAPDRAFFERIATKLKKLIGKRPTMGEGFHAYWDWGTEISEELSAHVALLKGLRR